ncbi:MAG: sialidase family protein [Sciscionella sp.]
MPTKPFRTGTHIPARLIAIAGTAALIAAVITALPATAAPSPRHHSPGAGIARTDIVVSTPPAATYRIPDIAVTARGTVILTYDRRNGSAYDLPNNIDVMQRRSTDNGRTWSAPRAIVNYPAPQGCGDSSMIVDHDTGRLLLFCTYSAGKVGFGSSQPGTADTTDPNTLHVQVRHSDDDGLTWSGPTDINPQVKDKSWRGYFASSGHGIQTSTGRLIQPVVVKDAAGAIHSADLYSDDDGATWHAGALLSANTDESKAVELADGRIVQNSRPDVGGYRFLSTSTDGGRTFSAAAADPNLPDPHVNGDEIRVNPSAHGPHRHWLLFANAASQRGRDNLTIRLSCDDGASWPVSKLLHAGPSGYATMAMLPDGRIGVFAETGTNSYTEKMTFTSFGLDDLGARCGH